VVSDTRGSRSHILVVGSTKWIQKKMVVGQPTVDALKMSWDEDISSTEAVDKLNEGAQAKPNAGISPFFRLLNY
jgi:hypothetical protein